MSWTKKINHPGEVLKKGDTVEVKVLDVDPEKRRISLGIRQLTEDPWPNFASTYAVGTEIVSCEVARILDRGLVVNLGGDVEGFIPLNQLGRESLNHPSRVYKVGDAVPAEIVEFDLESRKIVLSVEEYFKDKNDLRKAHEEAFPLKPAAEGSKPQGKSPKGKGKKQDVDQGGTTAEDKAGSAAEPDGEDNIEESQE